MTDTPTLHHWHASDGAKLAYHAMGEGRPLILIHGLASSAHVNWIKYGAASALMQRGGVKLIMPDLRAHGASEMSRDPAHYPPGVLGRDLQELIAHLGLSDGAYDLGGFSLGARTTAQGVGEGGLKPGKAMLAGMGYEGLSGWLGRQGFFIEALDKWDAAKRGDAHWMSIQFMKTMKIDREALRLLLPTFTDAPDDWLKAFTMPTMVLCGTEDKDNGSASELAERLPGGQLVEIPGTHMSSVTKPEFGAEIAAFFAS